MSPNEKKMRKYMAAKNKYNNNEKKIAYNNIMSLSLFHQHGVTCGIIKYQNNKNNNTVINNQSIIIIINGVNEMIGRQTWR